MELKVVYFDFQLNPGDGLWVPIYAIHHDPQYFKDPETFNPERFSDDNKGDIRPFSFMPFGIGPRNCIGDFKIYLFNTTYLRII